MNKLTKRILQILSYESTEWSVETARKITELKKLDPIRVIAKSWIGKFIMEIIKFR